MVVNSIRAGAVDGDLETVLAAERRRSPPREPVLTALHERMNKRNADSGEESDE